MRLINLDPFLKTLDAYIQFHGHPSFQPLSGPIVEPVRGTQKPKILNSEILNPQCTLLFTCRRVLAGPDELNWELSLGLGLQGFWGLGLQGLSGEGLGLHLRYQLRVQRTSHLLQG